MKLNRQHNRVIIKAKSKFSDGFNNVLKADDACQGVTVGHNGLTVFSVPNVDFHAFAAFSEGVYVGLAAGVA